MKRTLLSLCFGIFMLGFSRPALSLEFPSDYSPVSTDIGLLAVHTQDHPVPWPWGSEMPFPWTIVQGVWFAKQNEFQSYYTFRIVKQKSGLNQVEVKQVDPVTCEVIATGVGFEENRVMRAQMSVRGGGGAYRLFLRAFSTKRVPPGVKIDAKPVNDQYVVLSVIPFDASKTVSIPMQLITNRLGFQCRVQE